MHSVKQEYLSEEDYLAQEHSSPVKHEYADGQVFAMAGASIRHNRIAGNLYVAWRQGSHCRVVFGDVKVKGRRVYYYPDVMLSCEPQSDAFVETAPCMVAEVLSPTTEVIDRGEKLHHYQQIPSLQAYLLVAQDERRVEVYRRAGELWTYQSITDDRPIELPCLDAPLSLSEIYAGMDFDQPPGRVLAQPANE